MDIELFIDEVLASGTATVEQFTEAVNVIKKIESTLNEQLYQLNLRYIRLYENAEQLQDALDECTNMTPGEKKVFRARLRRARINSAIRINSTGRSNDNLTDLLNFVINEAMKKRELADAIICAANIGEWPKEVIERIRARFLAKPKDVLNRHYDYIDSHKNREGAAIYSIAVGTGIEIRK